MTHTISGGGGRLGNQIIRGLAVSIIAEKHDLRASYFDKELIKKLGINLFSGNNSYESTVYLLDENYFSILNQDILDTNLDATSRFFQTKDITNLLYNYLHSSQIKSNIIDVNPFKERYNSNNDLYIHIRLTDAVQWNPGLEYYIKTIKNFDFDKLYISSDDTSHFIITQILENYPDAEIINYDETETIQFASTCKNIILSHGSFSAVIGYLAFFSNISYPEYQTDKIWYGDMFSINGWNKILF